MTETVHITTQNSTIALKMGESQLYYHQICESFADQSIRSIHWAGLRNECDGHFFFGYSEN